MKEKLHTQVEQNKDLIPYFLRAGKYSAIPRRKQVMVTWKLKHHPEHPRQSLWSQVPNFG